jgi:hypothetical protein
MPEELWRSAVALAREHGAYAAAQGLRINYDSLRTRMGRAPKSREPRLPTAFVELSPALPIGGTVLELVAASGQKLTIRLGGAGELDVGELCRDFWSAAG